MIQKFQIIKSDSMTNDYLSIFKWYNIYPLISSL
jgi:hypothetical protein